MKKILIVCAMILFIGFVLNLVQAQDNSTLVINTNGVPKTCIEGKPCSFILIVTGGTGPYDWRIKPTDLLHIAGACCEPLDDRYHGIFTPSINNIRKYKIRDESGSIKIIRGVRFKIIVEDLSGVAKPIRMIITIVVPEP